MLKSKHIANAVLIQEWPIVDCCLPLVVVTFVTPTSSCSSSAIAAAAAAAVPSPVAAIEASLVLGLSAVTASGRRHQIFRLGGSVVTCGRRHRSSLLWRWRGCWCGCFAGRRRSGRLVRGVLVLVRVAGRLLTRLEQATN